MSSAFAERLHASAIELDESTTERWRAAIGDYAEDVPKDAIPDIVRAAFQRDFTSDAVEALRSACVKGGDDAEIAGDANFLMGLLACQALIEVFDRRGTPIYVWAGLLVNAAHADGWSPTHPDVVTAARAALSTAAIRSFEPTKPPRASGQSSSTKEALEALATADWGVYRNAIVELANEITRLRNHSTRLANYVNEAQRPILEQQEIAWWVISRRSLSLDRPFSSLPDSAAPCIAALDLARIAPRPPGPFAATSFLAQALAQPAGEGRRDVVPMSSVVEQLQELDAVSLFPEPEAAIADFLPILSAVHSSEPPEGGDQTLQTLAERTHVEIYLAQYAD